MVKTIYAMSIIASLLSGSAVSAQGIVPKNSKAPAKSVDDRRKADVLLLQDALEKYARTHNGSYAVNGYGSAGAGAGWANAPYPGYGSIVQGLFKAGVLSVQSLDDPAQNKAPNYMVYVCDNGRRYSVAATLDSSPVSQSSREKAMCNAEGPNGVLTTYKKNYIVGN